MSIATDSLMLLFTKYKCKWPTAISMSLSCCTDCQDVCVQHSAVARVSDAPPEISRGAPHTLLAYYYELQ